MTKIRIEKLKKENIENVFEIEKTFFDVGSINSIENSFDSKTLEYFVLFLDEIIVGFLECSVVLDEAELYEIAIKKDFQGKGLSKYLMEYFFEYLKQKNVRTVFLEVNKINSKAISLYQKCGFEAYGDRKNYYGDNDAILMKKQF